MRREGIGAQGGCGWVIITACLKLNSNRWLDSSSPCPEEDKLTGSERRGLVISPTTVSDHSIIMCLQKDVNHFELSYINNRTPEFPSLSVESWTPFVRLNILFRQHRTVWTWIIGTYAYKCSISVFGIDFSASSSPIRNWLGSFSNKTAFRIDQFDSRTK